MSAESKSRWSMLAMVCWLSCAAAAPPEAGLVAQYRSLVANTAIDALVVDDPSLFVPEGQPPTPFLPAGRFEVRWSGFLHVDLRSYCSFRVDLSGEFELSLNGTTVMTAAGRGESTGLTRTVRLNKGANQFEAVFRSPEQGDAMVRLWWTDGDSGLRPVSRTALRVGGERAVIERTQPLREGRELFYDYRCGRCHGSPRLEGVPDGAVPAAVLDGIGSRRAAGWLARWVLDPRAVRPDARMPRLLRGPEAEEDSMAIAAYLATLTGDTGAPDTPSTGDAGRGKALFDELHCAVCHLEPGTSKGDDEDDERLGLAGVKGKFKPGALAAFLRRPGAHFAWIRMPNFGLSGKESEDLAAYLVESGGAAAPGMVLAEGATVERGKRLVATLGCVNCHPLAGLGGVGALPLEEMGSEGGCLGGAGDGATLPEFSLSREEREALGALLRSDRTSIGRSSLPEFARRQVNLLGCGKCHGVLPGFPSLDEIGGKLKPEWMALFLAGEIPYKPRPWLAARMPRFPVRANDLALGLAMKSGFAPRTPSGGEVDMERAEVGRRLVGKGEGFSCVACHAVGSQKATDVFDSEGINLAHAAERLQYPFFRRWLLDPLTIDPATKMPDFFDGLESPFTEIEGGDAGRQVESIWHYLRQGARMVAPRVVE